MRIPNLHANAGKPGRVHGEYSLQVENAENRPREFDYKTIQVDLKPSEYVDDLVFDEFFDRRARVAEVLAGIEMVGVFRKVLADRRRASHAQVGVDVDLANRHRSRLAEHLFGYADRIGHLAAELVDDRDPVLRHGGCAVQNDGESGQALAYLLEDIKAQLRLLTGFEFIRAVAGADGDGEGVAARLLGEFANLVGLGEAGVLRLHVHRVLDARELPQLRFDHDAAVVRVFDYLAGDFNVFFEGVVRSVDHDGSEPVLDCRLAGLEVGTVVEVQNDGQTRRFLGGEYEVAQIHGVGIFARARRNLQDERGIALLARFHDTLNGLHVVHVERADRIAAGIRFSEHFGRCYQRHKTKPP